MSLNVCVKKRHSLSLSLSVCVCECVWKRESEFEGACVCGWYVCVGGGIVKCWQTYERIVQLRNDPLKEKFTFLSFSVFFVAVKTSYLKSNRALLLYHSFSLSSQNRWPLTRQNVTSFMDATLEKHYV